MSDGRTSANNTNSQAAAQARSTPDEARRRLAATFQHGELVWLIHEDYDPDLGLRHLDVLRQSTFGRWTQQRYRFDEAADVLYFLGETPLDDANFATVRARSQRFPTDKK